MRTRKTIYTATIAAALSAACVWSIAVMAPVHANQKVYRSVTAADEERAQQLLAQADAEREAGDYTAAIEHYTQVIRIDERIGGYAERAYCRYKLGDYEAAERDANTAIHRRSARELTKAGVAGMAELVRGMSRYQRGEYDAAAEDLKMVRGTRYDTPEVRAVCDEVRAKIEERAAAERAARREAYMEAAAAIYARVQSADPPERCATMRWADYSSEPVRTDAVPPLSELMGHVFLLTDPYGFHTIPHPENPERADISTMLIRGKPTSGLVHFCVLPYGEGEAVALMDDTGVFIGDNYECQPLVIPFFPLSANGYMLGAVNDGPAGTYLVSGLLVYLSIETTGTEGVYHLVYYLDTFKGFRRADGYYAVLERIK